MNEPSEEQQYIIDNVLKGYNIIDITLFSLSQNFGFLSVIL